MVYKYLLIAALALFAAQFNFDIGTDVNDICGVVLTVVAVLSVLLAIFFAGRDDKRL